MDSLRAISVFDGRYSRYTVELKDIFSEYGLIRRRVVVEVAWLTFLMTDLKLETVCAEELRQLESIAEGFDVDAARQVKEIEKTTNHDVKAVEYYIKDRLTALGLGRLKEWTHFCCTSDDINNTAYSLMVRSGRDLMVSEIEKVIAQLEALALEYKSVPMMSRTHGQPATPTTVGKEMVNFAWRLKVELTTLKSLYVHGKFNGASGNYNAHCIACPDIDWIAAGERFIGHRLGLMPILYTTQINPNHYLSEILHSLVRVAGVLIDLDRDMWGYISLGYFRQKTVPGEVGSSTMPHKVNPIDFENSEGNLGMAVALLEHLSVKLLQSRFQRDLTDSTVLRNLGAVWGYMVIGLKSLWKGMAKVAVDREAIDADLAANPELLAEAVQTVMRVYKEENPYEKLKRLTRGRKMTVMDLQNFVSTLEKVPDDVKKRLSSLTVSRYTGLAEALVDRYFNGRFQSPVG